jgi:hypothetical protein
VDAQHAITDLDNELIMPLPIRRFAFLAVALSLASPLMAQQDRVPADGKAGRKPLNLSLPREAIFPPGTVTRQDPTLRDNLRAPARPDDASDKAESGRAGRGQDGAADAPYGTGFEARQRGVGAGGFGGAPGGGQAGGRSGAGRGR